MLLHAMLRIRDVEKSLFFFSELGLREVRRVNQPMGRFTLIFLTDNKGEFELELTHNWDQEEDYSIGNGFGHIAIGVDDIYDSCKRLSDIGATIARPPRDGFMAFVKSPDGISIELLQKGTAKPTQEPWASMENIGTW